MPGRMILFSSIVRFAGLVCTISYHSADSGHGGQTKDHDGDEADGNDEGKSSNLLLKTLNDMALV